MQIYNNLNELSVCFLVGFFVSSLIMPMAVALSNRLGALSDIGSRHVGVTRIGRLGGVGVVLGMWAGLAYQIKLQRFTGENLGFADNKLYGFLIGSALVGFVGFWDDFRRLPAVWKFLGQLGGALVAYYSGIQISGVDLPLIEPLKLGLFSLPITLVWIIGIVNAVNLIDGLDGLAAGVVLFAGAVNLVAAISLDQGFNAILMVAVLGSTLGFFMFNWHPAKIYLGDGGAYSLGFVLATGSLLAPVQKASTGVLIIVPLLASGLPIFDTTLAIVRRFLNGKGIFDPDRGHLHHILLDLGIGYRRVVLGLYSVCWILGSIAIVTVLKRHRGIGVLLLVSSLVSGVCWLIGARRQYKNRVKAEK